MLRHVERVLLTVGAILLILVAAAFLDRSVASDIALSEFQRAQSTTPESTVVPADPSVNGKFDFALWSQKRIRAYRESLAKMTGRPLGVISVHRLGILAPVFEGTSDLVLNRGVGWIGGTARPGEGGNGNIGLAGHRDGFFRALKDVAVGDVMELETPGMVSYYAVDNLQIVYPEDVHVLKPRGYASLTIVTCYPFYFAGDAPQRFIVHGTLRSQAKKVEGQRLGVIDPRMAGSLKMVQGE